MKIMLRKLRKKTLLRRQLGCLVPILTLAFGAAAPALAATPDVGQAVNQIGGQVASSIKQQQPPAQPKDNVSIEVKESQPEAPKPAVGPKIKVNGFHITGQNIYREEQLQALVNDAVGQELTIGELKDVAGRIAQYFRDHDFVVANVYIPAQALKDGIVEIAVMPGKYSGVDIRNHSRLTKGTADRFLRTIKTGDYVKRSQLERTLLLLSDTAGISIKAVLTPGQDPGTTQLVVDIYNAARVSGYISANNFGNHYTGSNQRNLNLSLNDLSGRGDVLSVSGGDTCSGMENYSLDYMVPYGSRGWRLGVNYSHQNYTLNDQYGPLEANGMNQTFGIYAQYPIVRSRNYDLYGQIGLSRKQLVDDIDAFDSSNRRRANLVTLGLNGAKRDSRSVNSFALNIENGRLGFTGGRDVLGRPWEWDDAEGAQTGGRFTKANVYFNRLQYINKRLNFYFSFTGQLASRNLDSSEQLYLGGGNGVRAYGQGEASGDQGFLMTGELRYNLPIPNLQLAAFIDGGYVDGSKSGWAGGNTSRTLSGAGLGLILNNTRNKYSIRVDYAWKLSSSEDTSETPNKHGRWWLTGIRYL